MTFLHDVTQRHHSPRWHQLTFAARGHLEVLTADARRLVPADRAVWVPAGTEHTNIMRAPVSMRSLFVAVGAIDNAADRVRTIECDVRQKEVLCPTHNWSLRLALSEP